MILLSFYLAPDTRKKVPPKVLPTFRGTFFVIQGEIKCARGQSFLQILL